MDSSSENFNNIMTDADNYTPQYHVPAENVFDELKKHMLVDGFDLVLDLEKSRGSIIKDARNGRKLVDFFTSFASMPIGFNHPKMNEPGFIEYLGKLGLNKPSSSDVYTETLATFLKTFFKIAVPPAFKYAFFIDGGTLAIENALKVAFDWKVLKNRRKGYTTDRGQQILHFKQAFHGRSGYTMSLTNTDPVKTASFPKFNWPRVHNPYIKFPLTEENLQDVIRQEQQSIAGIMEAFKNNQDDIAAIILEPIQAEGGDNHFRPEFLKELRRICDEQEALLIFDEVQTGVGLTGTMWAFEQLGVTPDILAFGKKMQTCGIIVTNRIDDEPENVFHVSSRINSTWGSNLVDMARVTKYLEIIQEENLLKNAAEMGEYLMQKLQALQQQFPQIISNVRGRGLMCAFDFSNAETRANFRTICYEKGLVILAAGSRSIRFRTALNITRELIDQGMDIITESVREAATHNPDTNGL
ncbi:MAG: L-lysine 6-transaminase [Bacteroidota bacterium]